jgi:hypothetical protein
MTRLSLLTLLLLAAGCGAATMADKASMPSDCGNNYSTLSLVVAPAALTRGAVVDIDVVWTLEIGLTAPVVATLIAGHSDEIEVDVALLRDPGMSTSYSYSGSQLNPFGAGVPAGPASVVATAGRAPGCDIAPTATASFELR